MSPPSFRSGATPSCTDWQAVRLNPTASVLRKLSSCCCCPSGSRTLSQHANGHPAAVATDPFAGFVAEASHRFALPASWIRAVMQAESGGDVRALSPKGAMGLMQIMPGNVGRAAAALRPGCRSL